MKTKKLNTVLKNIREFTEEKLSKQTWIPGIDQISYSKPDFGSEEYVAAASALLSDLDSTIETEIFEKVCANVLGKKYGVLVNSGSAANFLMTRIIKDVIMEKQDFQTALSVAGPSSLFAAISLNRMSPMPIDLDFETLLPDVNIISRLMEKNNIKAIALQHILGNAIDVSIVENCHLPIVEDCSQALGSMFYEKPLGSFGMLASCSFDNTCNVSMINGGLIATDNEEQYIRLKSLRNNGITAKPQPTRFGKWIERLPYDMVDNEFIVDAVALDNRALEVQAAIGNIQLTKLEDTIAKRKKNYTRLYTIFNKYNHYFHLHTITNGCESTFHAFPVSVQDNELFTLYEIRQFFEDAKISTRPFFANNIAFNPGYSHVQMTLAQAHQIFPNSFKVMRSTFLLPTNSNITENQLNYIEEKLDEFIKYQLSAKPSQRIYSHETSI